MGTWVDEQYFVCIYTEIFKCWGVWDEWGINPSHPARLRVAEVLNGWY